MKIGSPFIDDPSDRRYGQLDERACRVQKSQRKGFKWQVRRVYDGQVIAHTIEEQTARGIAAEYRRNGFIETAE